MDITYLLFLQNLRLATFGIFDNFMELISGFAMPLVSMFLICLIYWCLNKSKGKVVMLTYVFCGFFTPLLKLQFAVYRPFMRCSDLHPLDMPTGYSFPSFHSTKAAGLYLSIANQFREIKVVKFVCLLMIPLIMFSRNWLGVHTPQDVLVGFLVGAISWIIALNLSKALDEKKNLDLLLFAVFTFLAYFAIQYFLTKSYPMATDSAGKLLIDPLKKHKDAFEAFGLVIGYFLGTVLEKRFVGFAVPEKLGKKLSVLFLGYMIFLFVHTVCASICFVTCARNWAVFSSMFLDIFYVTFLFPIIIKKFFN